MCVCCSVIQGVCVCCSVCACVAIFCSGSARSNSLQLWAQLLLKKSHKNGASSALSHHFVLRFVSLFHFMFWCMHICIRTYIIDTFTLSLSLWNKNIKGMWNRQIWTHLPSIICYTRIAIYVSHSLSFIFHTYSHLCFTHIVIYVFTNPNTLIFIDKYLRVVKSEKVVE